MSRESDLIADLWIQFAAQAHGERGRCWQLDGGLFELHSQWVP